MKKTALLLADSGARICVGKLRQGAEIWYVDCEMRQLSRNTVDNRRFAVDKLLWFLEENGYDECGILELKKFFAYFSNGHEVRYNPWHYISVLERKPGALRSGAPFKDWELPEPLSLTQLPA